MLLHLTAAEPETTWLTRSTLSVRASALSDILLPCCETITVRLISDPLEQAVRPHLGAIAAKMEEMWSASQLSVSERNVLCDSMLAAAASGDPQLHSQVQSQCLLRMPCDG